MHLIRNSNFLNLLRSVVSPAGLPAARRLRDVKALSEFIILSLVNEVLAVNVCELVIMAVNDYLARHDTLESIVVALYDNLLGLPIVLGIGGRSFAVGENIVVVAVDHDFGRFGVLLEDYLIVVAIDG